MTRTYHSRSIAAELSAEGGSRCVAGLARGLFISVAAAALGACTMVRVSDGSAVRTTYYPGLAVVRIAPGNSTHLVEVRALGAAIVGNQASLGWLDSQIALVPQGRCHLVLWQAAKATADELRTLFGPETEICDSEGEKR